jgi:hypothetical protein
MEALDPVPACCAIANVVPITVSVNTNIDTRLILGFMLILSASPNPSRYSEEMASSSLRPSIFFENPREYVYH